MVWPETLSRTPWLINKSAGGTPFWQFGQDKPRLGGLSVAETEERRIAVAKDGAKRAVATRARRRGKLEALKAAGAPGGLE